MILRMERAYGNAFLNATRTPTTPASTSSHPRAAASRPSSRCRRFRVFDSGRISDRLELAGLFAYIRVVPTTVHIPKPLLVRVDARARALGKTRNRLVIEALEHELAPSSEWPADLVRLLTTPVTAEVTRAVDDMSAAILRGRKSRKNPPKL